MDSNPVAPLQIIKFFKNFFLTRKGFLYFMLTCTTTLLAQINGKVMDSLNNPLIGVSVYIQDSFVGTVTNSEGKFYLGNLPSENGIVVFKSLGYKTIKRSYDLELTSVDFEVKMKEEFISLEEITLKSEENPATQ